MTRDEIFKDMEDVFGEVPLGFRYVPEPYLEHLWELWKSMYSRETHIPNKYKELISLAVTSAIGDDLDPIYYAESAKRFGATEEEIQEVAAITRLAVGWLPYFRANQVDREHYKEEMRRIDGYMRSRDAARSQKEETPPKASV